MCFYTLSKRQFRMVRDVFVYVKEYKNQSLKRGITSISTFNKEQSFFV